MTDERTEVRSVLEGVSADLPPTRLTVNGICAEAHRRRARRWLPTWPRNRSISVPSGAAVLKAVAVAVAVAVAPGLLTLAFLRAGSGGDLATQSGGAVASQPSPQALTPMAGAAASPQLAVGTIVELATDHRTLVASVGVSVCHGPLELRLLEGPTKVTITANEDTRGLDISANCRTSLMWVTLTARLSQPLGARPVVDVRTGRTMAVGLAPAVQPTRVAI